MGQRILHIIDSLARGGAELLLVRFIESLPQDYENFVVIMSNETELLSKLSNVTNVYKLGWKSKIDTMCCALRLFNIVEKDGIDLVHAHLFWSTIIARLAIPSHVPMIFTVHNELSQEIFRSSVAGMWLERLTYSSKEEAVFVSEVVKADYSRHIAINNHVQVVHNFVDDVFFEEENHNKNFSSGKLKLVSVANLKRQKNHQLLLKAMAKLDLPQVSLDIIGEGPERANLQRQIKQLDLRNVELQGVKTDIAHLLKNYDVFVLASTFEGFCIAMAEAMAVGLPCLVSNLPVLREISEDNQLYFAPDNVDDLTKQIQLLVKNKDKLVQLKFAGMNTAQKYRKANYTVTMVRLYEKLLERNKHAI